LATYGDISGDHPRSRGVYPSVSMGRLFVVGSSPLARGLPTRAASRCGAGGIIPARAGFTGRRRHSGSPSMDHPRSRGVYVMVGSGDSAGAGSSPLARGLLPGAGTRRSGTRIIPARAGFTLVVGGWWLVVGDHPRSRGVYTASASAVTPISGSSPLARGLHHPSFRNPPTSGIIPARAGFTTEKCTMTRRKWDHPRSRGVYGHDGHEAVPQAGSSPLARGLLYSALAAEGRDRIIPARAGFT